jgi:cell wall-associated NlpC family hydrolase
MLLFRKIIIPAFIFSFFLILTGCNTPYPRFTSEDTKKNVKEEKDEDDILVENKIETVSKEELTPYFDSQKMMDHINKRIGVPYKYGGKDESGFDCSGFTSFIYEKSAKIKITSSSVDQYKIGKKIDRTDLIFGDLVFFNTTGRIPSHVGIYVGSGLFAHSSSQKGVTISSLNSAYYKKRFIGARRVIF